MSPFHLFMYTNRALQTLSDTMSNGSLDDSANSRETR